MVLKHSTRKKMNKIYSPKREDWKSVLERPTQTVSDIEATVNTIFNEVQKDGDAILKKYTQQFGCLLLHQKLKKQKL